MTKPAANQIDKRYPNPHQRTCGLLVCERQETKERVHR